jgi:hypothetical protein
MQIISTPSPSSIQWTTYFPELKSQDKGQNMAKPCYTAGTIKKTPQLLRQDIS